MKILDFQTEYRTPIAIALGFFDCIHIGHATLIESTRRIADLKGIDSALFTFSNDINTFFGGEKQIYSFSDRAEVLRTLGINVVIGARFDSGFAKMSPTNFLDALVKKFNIAHIAVGADYTFGKGASGTVEFLSEWCKAKSIGLSVVPFTTENGVKISTSSLKDLVKRGEVDKLGAYLTQPYFMRGRVVHDREVGRGLGFPTANIPIDTDRLKLRDGIYATRIEIDGKLYASMTNIGAKPTFGDERVSIETYIFDFDGDIYGKDVTLSFFRRTRDVTKFSSPNALKSQLVCDELQIREIIAEIEKDK